MANKYNFQIRSKVGMGLYGGNRYFSAWLNDDSSAIGLADAFTPSLSNYCKIGVSKQIRLIPQNEIPSNPTLTDTYLYRFLMVSTTGARYSVDLPVKPSVNPEGLVQLLNSAIKDELGNRCKCLSFRIIGQNIVQGGVING